MNARREVGELAHHMLGWFKISTSREMTTVEKLGSKGCLYFELASQALLMFESMAGRKTAGRKLE